MAILMNRARNFRMLHYCMYRNFIRKARKIQGSRMNNYRKNSLQLLKIYKIPLQHVKSSKIVQFLLDFFQLCHIWNTLILHEYWFYYCLEKLNQINRKIYYKKITKGYTQNIRNYPIFIQKPCEFFSCPISSLPAMLESVFNWLYKKLKHCFVLQKLL